MSTDSHQARTQADVAVNFSPFYTSLQDALDRLLEFIPPNSFTFCVKGEALPSTFREAITISPKVSELLRFNPMTPCFTISEDSIDSNDFKAFLEFCRCRDFVQLPRDRVLSFVNISSYLGNECLALGLLSSMGSTSTAAHASPALPNFGANRIDECASQFYSYSVDELRCVDQEILHRLLSSSSLSLENEDCLLRLLLDLDVDRSEFLCHIEIAFLSSDGLSLLLDNLTLDELSSEIWEKIIARLKGIVDSDLQTRRYRKQSSISLILDEFPSFLQDIEGTTWTLLYRGSADGFDAADFHGKCDGRSNTVTIIETTNGSIFGGFTPTAWDSTSGYKSDNSQKSFLFTVKNPRGSAPRKFALSDSSKAIWCTGKDGPVFGTNDICVLPACNANTKSSTKLGPVYSNDTEISGQQVFTGESNFTAKEIEVFSIQ
jgi:hypothetical protein